MFKRKIYSKMQEWKKDSDGKTALLIEGARRIGKSTVVEEFAKNEYESYILIDFARASKETKELFEDVSDLNFLFLQLQLQYRVDLQERKSVIILLKNQVFMKVVRRLRLLPVPENQTARASHPEQVKIMLRPRLLHKQQLKKVLKQKKQQRRPAIQRIKQQQKRVQQLLLKNWTTPKQRKKLPAHRKAAQVL